MLRRQLDLIGAMAVMGVLVQNRVTGELFRRRANITDGNRTFKTQPDTERLATAELKRARKNAKRLGLVELPASDDVVNSVIPK